MSGVENQPSPGGSVRSFRTADAREGDDVGEFVTKNVFQVLIVVRQLGSERDRARSEIRPGPASRQACREADRYGLGEIGKRPKRAQAGGSFDHAIVVFARFSGSPHRWLMPMAYSPRWLFSIWRASYTAEETKRGRPASLPPSPLTLSSVIGLAARPAGGCRGRLRLVCCARAQSIALAG